MKKDSSQQSDGNEFSIKISENMEIRNQLRAGLIDALGADSDKIPLFVSWPPWLKDGIVCMYAKDLHALLRSTISVTAEPFIKLIEQPGDENVFEEIFEESEEPVVDEAREAAKAILERPLGQEQEDTLQDDEWDESFDDEGDLEPFDDMGQKDETELEEEEIAGTTRNLGSSLLQLSDNEEDSSDDGPPKTNIRQDLADELFKKYESGELE